MVAVLSVPEAPTAPEICGVAEVPDCVPYCEVPDFDVSDCVVVDCEAPYCEGKRCAETLFMDYRRQHKLRIKIAQVFNTYGPHRQPNDGRVVSHFIMQTLAHQPITIYGDGMQTQSFCYVDDLIDGFGRLMRSPDDFCGPANLGNRVECTMLELAETILELTQSRSTIRFLPLPSDDPVRRRPDISLARDFLA